MQEAEYRNRKKGMETGRTEEERSTGGTAVRGEREEGKGKNGRLSSQNPKLKRPKGSENSGGQKEKRKRQSAVKVEAQRSQKAKARKQGRARPSSCRE